MCVFLIIKFLCKVLCFTSGYTKDKSATLEGKFAKPCCVLHTKSEACADADSRASLKPGRVLQGKAQG